MAELRTIEKPLDIGILSVTGSILSLPDDYIIIPHLLYTSRKFDDYVLTVFGHNGIFLLSYQLFLNSKIDYNAIEDYRDIDPDSISTPLYTHPPTDKLRKAAEDSLEIFERMAAGRFADIYDIQDNLRTALGETK